MVSQQFWMSNTSITLCIAKRGAMIGVWLQFNPDLSGVTGHSEQTGTQLRPWNSETW
jgi:hypothetical protein